ncbi:P-loop containing nucleoside triphosphate hydrolase protein [Cytidiella melzeri]|nr:P-loop containing nucleoside triphosphate hydrolase protein [Cytidiella melzeri]
MATILDKDSVYAKRRQAHVSLINQLRAIGAQADLDLPRVVVIGNQSAGKSSLVEAISGITVPRDAGTCTRCPIECRMSTGPQWSCQISIRWEFSDDGSTNNNVREMLFGDRISDKSDVELMLRRAQAAVLNPTRDPQTFVKMTAKELRNIGGNPNQLQFSRNAVCIDLAAPDLADLAFIDLPGIIQNAQTEVVEMVEELVSSHIQGNCIILVTLPMSDDIENQKAMRLAKQADPKGQRTVGVLTKPDTIPSGATKSKELWLEPDEDERATHITPQDARTAESDFFAATSPWSTSHHRHRFGTDNLVASISTHLSRIIDESLPQLMTETKNQLTACNTRLAAIPPVTPEPFAFVLELVHKFSAEVEAYVKGGMESASLVQRNRSLYRLLKSQMRGTAPLFVPFREPRSSSHMPPELLLLEDSEHRSSSELGKQVTIAMVREKIESAVTRELPNNVPYVVKLMLIKEFQQDWPEIVHNTGQKVLQNLQDVLTSSITAHFGRYTHLKPSVKSTVDALVQVKYDNMRSQISKFLKYESTAYTQNDHYLSDAKETFLAQYKALHQASLTPVAAERPPNFVPLVPKLFPEYTSPGTSQFTKFNAFSEESVNGGEDFFISICSPAHGLTSWSYEELRVTDYQKGLKSSPGKPFTFSKPPSTSGFAVPVLTLQERREEEEAVLEGLKKLGFGELGVTDLQRLKPSAQYEDELALMAEVRAYFKVAYKRIIDYVPLAIDHELLYAFADELQKNLISALGLSGVDAVAKCAAYLAEDPNVVAEREELLARKTRLLSVQAELMSAGITTQ